MVTLKAKYSKPNGGFETKIKATVFLFEKEVFGGSEAAVKIGIEKALMNLEKIFKKSF